MRARKQLNYIKPLHAGTARRMLVKQAAALEVKATKKRRKAEYAIAVAYKRAIR